MEAWLDHGQDRVVFSIRGSEVKYKEFVVGICAIKHIDWVARHGEVFFIMVDKDGHRATIHNHPASKKAFGDLLEFAFGELNLNKVWIEVYEHNDIKPVLEQFGFVAEGVRKDALFREGRFFDSVICSLMAVEHQE
jgi:RimJ/RimL family protein N-acetyltransferase